MRHIILFCFTIYFFYPFGTSLSNDLKKDSSNNIMPQLMDSSLTNNTGTIITVKLVSSVLETQHNDFRSTIYSPVYYLENNYDNNFQLNINFGVSFLNINRVGFGRFQSFDISNIVLGVGYNLNNDFNQQMNINFLAGIPTALFYSHDIDEKKLTEYNYNGVISGEGWSNPYLWLINTVPLIISKSAKFKIQKHIIFDYKISPSYLVSLNSRPSKFALLSNLNIGVEYKAMTVVIGLNNFISSVNIENNDYSQSSSRFGLKYQSSFYEIGLDYFLNIDAPNGIANSINRINWGLRVFSLFYV